MALEPDFDGDREQVFLFAVFLFGDLSEGVGVGESGFVGGLPAPDQPGTEVVEAIVGAAPR